MKKPHTSARLCPVRRPGPSLRDAKSRGSKNSWHCVIAHVRDEGRAEITPFQTKQHLSSLVRSTAAGQGGIQPRCAVWESPNTGVFPKRRVAGAQEQPWGGCRAAAVRFWSCGTIQWLLAEDCHFPVTTMCPLAARLPWDRGGPPSIISGGSAREVVSRSLLSLANWRGAQRG